MVKKLWSLRYKENHYFAHSHKKLLENLFLRVRQRPNWGSTDMGWASLPTVRNLYQ